MKTRTQLKHDRFIQAYLKTQDKVKAYMSVYPKAQQESARVKSSKLFQNSYIVGELERYSNILNIATIEKVAQTEAKSVLSLERKRELLRQIAEGEIDIPIKKPYWDKAFNKWTLIDMVEKASHSARIAAIELDCKITGELAPSKVYAGIMDLNNPDESGHVERFVILSNGEKIPL